MDNESTPFCQKSERAGLSCRPCFDHICTIKSPRKQRMYKELDLHDTIMVEPAKGGGFNVQSDVEIPFAVDPKKGTANVRDLMLRNQRVLKMELGHRLEGKDLRGPWFHQHYSANRLPDVAALHVHIAGTAKTHQEAARMVDEFWDIIDAERLTKLLE